MSDQIYHRYAYDPTGRNPDNLVVGEELTLTTRAVRVAVPMHGPFFVDSLVVIDKVTNRPLVRITNNNPVGDYSVPMISQEATLKLGMEVADSFLIMNEQLGDRVLVTYQAVGGTFQRNIQNVVNIFEAFLNDNRRVDWVNGLYGKPNYYPPSAHNHYLTDVFGFESMNFMLERIYQAILLGNVPAFEMILDAINQNKATTQDIDDGVVNDKVVPLNVLQYATNRYNFNQISLTPMEEITGQGKVVQINVTTTNSPNHADRLYWSIEHGTTHHDDFVLNSGSFEIYRGQGSFSIQTAINLQPEQEETFKILLRRGGPDRYVLLGSYDFKIKAHTSLYKDRILEAARISCIGSPRLRRTAKVLSVNRGIWKAQQS